MDWLIAVLSKPTAWTIRRMQGQGTIEVLIIFAIMVILVLTLTMNKVDTVMSKAASGLDR